MIKEILPYIIININKQYTISSLYPATLLKVKRKRGESYIRSCAYFFFAGV